MLTPVNPPGSPPPDDADVRRSTVLIVDIAHTSALRLRLGDEAGGKRIRRLLDAIIRIARESGGDFVKSYGDDMLATFERDGPNTAAKVAVRAHRLAREVGLQIYAGFHTGDIEFGHTLGGIRDALGLTVNIAARLHKLTEGVPGRIFFGEELLPELAPELRARATRFGDRDLRGVGSFPVWTLGWEDSSDTTRTALPLEGAVSSALRASTLVLRHRDAEQRLSSGVASGLVGRGRDCVLRLDDPDARISGTHLLLEHHAGYWFAQDVSRNGTWLLESGVREALPMPYCARTALPRAGRLCLGRPFRDDPDALHVVRFEIVKG